MLQEIKEVFSKEFREEVECLEFRKSMRQYVKLKNESESIDKKVDRLKAHQYVSNCSFKVGDFDEARNI